VGQYYKILNLDKAEYINPPAFGGGSKLGEFGPQLNLVLQLLLAKSNADAGEAESSGDTVYGRWAENRNAITGDYDSSGLYGRLKRPEYVNITSLLKHYLDKQAKFPCLLEEWQVMPADARDDYDPFDLQP
jgi:hypothetical protein